VHGHSVMPAQAGIQVFSVGCSSAPAAPSANGLLADHHRAPCRTCALLSRLGPRRCQPTRECALRPKAPPLHCNHRRWWSTGWGAAVPGGPPAPPHTELGRENHRRQPAVSRLVRPAWARSWRCKSSRELATVSEGKRNCVRVTERGEEAWNETASRGTRSAFEAASGRASGQATAKLLWSRRDDVDATTVRGRIALLPGETLPCA
jgi:hypothetical protein